MVDSREYFKQLLLHLQAQIEGELTADKNVCQLLDGEANIVATLELPEESDLLLIHRVIAPLSLEPDVRQGRALQLLALNGQPELLRGAWFSIDPDGTAIQLMTAYPIQALQIPEFENLLYNFINLGNTLAVEMAEEEQETGGSDLPLVGGVRI